MAKSNPNKKTVVPNHRLKIAREQRGWTHKDVADLIQLPDSHTVSRWERGISFPQPHYRRELCRIFEQSAEELGLLKQTTPEQIAPPVPNSQPGSLWKVPSSFTSFVGREHEVTTICSLLDRSDVRLVTLLGPGGVGKTRLSIQIAAQMQDHFVDGICFVSLATVRDPLLMAPTIAKALGIQENTALPVLEQIKMRLYQKHFLLILDNFEQLAADPPSLIVDLLAFCPDLKVVVTSRIVLHLPGEHEFPVLPLKLPELEHLPEPDALTQFASIALFVQRAQAALPDFTVTPENAHTIAAICVRLDGLPLAIELAAARVKLLPPRALLQRLEKPWHLLTTAQPMADDRQQTLYNTIQWSYDLLNEQEQDLFQRLAVFAGGCTLETAEAFLENDQKQTIDILSLFGSLLDKSLIRRVAHDSEQPRFRMLETIREFGLDRLRTQGTLERYQSDHALYYLALLEEAEPHLKGEQQAYWLTCLEQELENLQAALRYAVLSRQTALSLRFCEIFGKFCGLRGYWNEEMRWLNAVLALSETPDSLAMRARILRRAGHLAYRLRDLTMARALQEESVALSREVGDTQNLAGALSGLGWTLYRQKDAAATAGLLQESVAAARESGDQWAIANTLESLGRFMYYQGQVDEAHQLLEESIVIARTLGDRESLARILTTAVSIAISQHRIEQASALAQEAFRLAQELGAKPLIALVLDCRANIAMFQGEYQQAAGLLDARVSLAQELHDQPTIAVKRLQLATIALVQEDLARATTLVQESLTFFRKGKDYPNVASALHIFGNIKKARADFAQAMELYQEALLLDLEIGNTRKITGHLIAMALVAFEQHRFDLAACLFGLAESSQQAGSADIDPAQQKDYFSILPQVRHALGAQKFTAAWSQGYATTPEQIPNFLEQMV